jgi:hypothetical protein
LVERKLSKPLPDIVWKQMRIMKHMINKYSNSNCILNVIIN